MILPILNQALVLLPLLIGAYMTLSLLKLPDFSIESAYLFGAVIACLTKDLALPFVVLSSMLGGAMVGAIVSTLTQCLKLPFLLTAIITNGLFHGLTQYFLGTSLKSFHPAFLLSEHIIPVLVGMGVVSIIALLFRSQLGYSLAIYGNNPLFFQHHPISGRYVTFCGVMAGHGCAGIAGFLFALSNGFVDLTMNFGIILLCLTALILGKFFIRTHLPNILVPLTGLVIYFCIQQTLLHFGLNLKYFNAFQALVIFGLLCLFQRKKKISLDHLGV
ncbi:MAG: ABC transporter permease subunit [Anaerolineae bacterium]